MLFLVALVMQNYGSALCTNTQESIGSGSKSEIASNRGYFGRRLKGKKHFHAAKLEQSSS
jgi:hypothetical protein